MLAKRIMQLKFKLGFSGCMGVDYKGWSGGFWPCSRK